MRKRGNRRVAAVGHRDGDGGQTRRAGKTTSAHAVILCADTKRVLVVLSTAWSIPGGFCDGGEAHGETVRRELQEESGLQAGRGHWSLPLTDSGNAATLGAKIYVGGFHFASVSPQQMAAIFESRLHNGEATDYGFYRLPRIGERIGIVEDWAGTPKRHQGFRHYNPQCIHEFVGQCRRSSVDGGGRRARGIPRRLAALRMESGHLAV